MRRAIPTIPFLSLALMIAPAPARAAFTTYTSQSSFLAAAGTVSTETFDELFASPEPRMSFFGGDEFLGTSMIEINAGQGGTFPGQSTYIPTSQPYVLFQFSPGALAIAFAGQTTQALGFSLLSPTSVTASQPALYNATVYEAGAPVSVIPLTFTSGTPGYLGFVETPGSRGISEVLITPVADSGGTVYDFALDDVSRGPFTNGDFPVFDPGYVPEPASALMLGFGLAGVGLVVSLRSRSAPNPAPH